MDIKVTSSGQIIKMPTGYRAFIPHPLPPKIEWNKNLVNTLSKADYILGKLSRESSYLPNPHLLIRPFVTREAVLSSRIEGTQATVGEILANEAGVMVKRSTEELQEVNNYIQALNYGIKRLEELPLSLRLIRELHAKLMQGVREENATPGDFRNTQNWIGIPGCTLTTAKYIPPPPDNLMECMSSLESYLHDRELPALIHIALCHYQFEAIHPFLDGNGRVGRLLITLLLIDQQLLSSPLLYLSAFFEATRAAYYQHLYSVSALGSWDDWLIYFLNGVVIQATDALSRAERINQLIMTWNVKAWGSSSSLVGNIIKQLAVNPFVTTNKIALQFKVAFTTAQRAIQKLESLKILDNIGEKKRDRVYCATHILNILEEPTKISQESF
jgi:Fic family protein